MPECPKLIFTIFAIVGGLLFACCRTPTNGVSSSSRFANIKVQFVNAQVGWIVGPVLFRTTDAGQTWLPIRNEGIGTFRVEDIFIGRQKVQFLDTKTGRIVGTGVVACTTDSGQTWTSSTAADPNQRFQSLFFVSPDEGWVVGESVYHTSDSGKTWEQLSKSPDGNSDRQEDLSISPENAKTNPALWFTSAKNGIMARLDGEVYKTRDGGKTWESVWQVNNNIEDVFFLDDRQGWMVGSKGLIARTTDEGARWNVSKAPTSETLHSIFFINQSVGCAVGDGPTILFSEDGGLMWNKASISGLGDALFPLASVSFADQLHGWAVGGLSDPMPGSSNSATNVVLVTTDGGRSWRATRL